MAKFVAPVVIDGQTTLDLTPFEEHKCSSNACGVEGDGGRGTAAPTRLR